MPEGERPLATEQWERLAERPGDVITALAMAPDGEGRTRVFAGTASGLRQSIDGGRTWAALAGGDGLPVITSFAPSPTFAADQILFLGTVDGCFRSTDGGHTCRPVLSGGQVLAVAVAPHDDPATGEPGPVFAGTEWDGIYRSDDGGEHWDTVNAGLLDLTVLALACPPGFERDRIGFAATASGLYRTTNGGKAWRWVDLGREEPAVQCLAVSPRFGEDGLAFAGTEDHGLYRSVDAGATWEPATGAGAPSVTAVAFAGDGVVATATDHGIIVSADAGFTWQRRGEDLGPVLALCFVPDDGRDMLLAGLVGAGITRSEDSGGSWVRIDQSATASAASAR
jgi:photosystem II stability/assembly factor-like uncharacterized protein